LRSRPLRQVGQDAISAAIRHPPIESESPHWSSNFVRNVRSHVL
jgi:hypothetical protein